MPFAQLSRLASRLHGLPESVRISQSNVRKALVSDETEAVKARSDLAAVTFGICDDPDYFTQKRSFTMNTDDRASIRGKGVLTFRPVDDDQAHE